MLNGTAAAWRPGQDRQGRILEMRGPCVVRRAPYNAGMRRFALHPLHRWTPWVLAAWLCVLLGSGVSPQVHAASWWQAAEPLCSASHAPSEPGASHGATSPGALGLGGEGQAAAHGLDCALCLPWLVPPPAHALSASQTVTALLPWTVGGRAPWVHQAAAALPARGPPVGVVSTYS